VRELGLARDVGQAGVADQEIIDAALIGVAAGVAQPRAGVALRVEVDQQDALLGGGQGRGEVHRRGGLSHAALLIRYRDDPSHENPGWFRR
jgi:hypothetical protein